MPATPIHRTLAAAFLAFLFAAFPASAAPVKASPVESCDEAEALIEQLLDVDRRDTGYCGELSGSPFLPFGNVPPEAAGKPASGAMRALVKLGPRALPALLAHLGDARPTKFAKKDYGAMSSMSVKYDDDEPGESQPMPDRLPEMRYTVKVGDLCYVAVGQIVNRKYEAVSFHMRHTLVTCVPKSKALRAESVRAWTGLTAQEHRNSLVRDFTTAKDGEVRNGAIFRLAFYHPAEVEPLALRQLARPVYSASAIRAFIETKLVPAKSSDERRRVAQELAVAKGEVACDGLRHALFEHLLLEERNGLFRPKEAKPGFSRQYLTELFELPATVTYDDRPKVALLDGDAQAEFVQTLRHCSGGMLDRAVRDLLTKADDDVLALRCLEHLVGRGYDADIEAYLTRQRVRPGDEGRSTFATLHGKLGWTRLHVAVDLGLLEAIEAAIKERHPLDTQGKDGRTALHIAAGMRYDRGERAVALLLNAGANPNVRDEIGRLPIELAAYNDDAKIVRRLAAHKSDIPDAFSAALLGSAAALEAVVKADPESVKRQNEFGLTPLHVAAREGHADAVRVLIAAGADANALDNFTEKREYHRSATDRTPLHHAKTAAVAKLLLDAGAGPNAAEADKQTPLHGAAARGDAGLVALLLARGADPAAKDKHDRTPRALAQAGHHTDVVELLGK